MHMYCNRIRMDDILSALCLHTMENSTSLLDGHWCRGYEMVRQQRLRKESSVTKPRVLSAKCPLYALHLHHWKWCTATQNWCLGSKILGPKSQQPKLSREASVKCIARISSAPKDATSVSSPRCTSGWCTYFFRKSFQPVRIFEGKEAQKKTHLQVVPVQLQLLHFRRSWCAWRFVLVTCWPWISADAPGRQPKWCFRGSWMVGGNRKQDETGWNR